MIDELKSELESSVVFPNVIISGKIEILEELKIDLNDPEAVEDITENVQQTLNVIETKKIIGDEL